MTEQTQRPETKNNFLRMLPGILVSVIAIAVLLSQINLGQTVEEFQKVKLSRMIMATLILVVAFVTRAIGWRVLLQDKVSHVYPVRCWSLAGIHRAVVRPGVSEDATTRG